MILRRKFLTMSYWNLDKRRCLQYCRHFLVDNSVFHGKMYVIASGFLFPFTYFHLSTSEITLQCFMNQWLLFILIYYLLSHIKAEFSFESGLLAYTLAAFCANCNGNQQNVGILWKSLSYLFRFQCCLLC